MNDNLPLGAEHDPRAPYNREDESIAEAIVEELTMQTLSAFRNMLVDRIHEDIMYEMKQHYSTPIGWEDFYSENQESIIEAVFDEVYSRLTEKLNTV